MAAQNPDAIKFYSVVIQAVKRFAKNPDQEAVNVYVSGESRRIRRKDFVKQLHVRFPNLRGYKDDKELFNYLYNSNEGMFTLRKEASKYLIHETNEEALRYEQEKQELPEEKQREAQYEKMEQGIIHEEEKQHQAKEKHQEGHTSSHQSERQSNTTKQQEQSSLETPEEIEINGEAETIQEPQTNAVTAEQTPAEEDQTAMAAGLTTGAAATPQTYHFIEDESTKDNSTRQPIRLSEDPLKRSASIHDPQVVSIPYESEAPHRRGIRLLKRGVSTIRSNEQFNNFILDTSTNANISFTRAVPRFRQNLFNGLGRIISIPFPNFDSSGGGGGGTPGLPGFSPGNLFNKGRAAVRNARRLAQIARLGGNAAKAASLFASTEGIIIIAVIIILLVIIVLPILSQQNQVESLCPGYKGDCSTQNTGTPLLTSTLKIRKYGPAAVANGSQIDYKIDVTYTGFGTADVEVTDKLPQDTTYLGATPPDGILHWTLNGLKTYETKTITFSVKALDTKQDYWVINNADAKITNITGTSTALLPVPLPPPPDGWDSIKQQILNSVMGNQSNLDTYQKASQATGVPWEVLAAIHFNEAQNNPNGSLVSGRAIGSNEPDVVASGGGCSSEDTGPGKPIPVPGGCGFASLLDSAIYAANHLIGKNNGVIPQTYNQIVTAFSKYNGGGNSNCWSSQYDGLGPPRTPYNYCSPVSNGGGPDTGIFGEDDPYAMNKFDQKHDTMYLIYCADNRACPPQPFGGFGALTVIRAIAGG